MKVTARKVEFKSESVMNVCCDVHRKELFFFARLPGREFSDSCLNRTAQVHRQLKSFHEAAVSNGRETIRVVCEPTGEYDRILLRAAHRMGFLTSYVNTENVARYRQIETNDGGKTDTKDPRVMASLAEQGKVLRVRNLGEEYLALRKLGSISEDEEHEIVRLKVQLDREIFALFCEYDFNKDFLFFRAGCALVRNYGCNPYRIVKDGFCGFEKKMKASVKGIFNSTIRRIWDSAERSMLHEMPEMYTECLEERIRSLHEDCLRHIEYRKKIEQQMIDIVEKLRGKDPNIPRATPEVMTEKNMAKLLAETGPLSDFESWRQLMRYAGLNLVERESGTYCGKIRASKKGRRRLRKVLSGIVYPIVPRGKLYGCFYHGKKDACMMPGNKAMVAAMRNFLRKFFGWYKSGGGPFDRERWFKCESQHVKKNLAA